MNATIISLVDRFRALSLDERRTLDARLSDAERDELYPQLSDAELDELATEERILAGIAADPDAAPLLTDQDFADMAAGRNGWRRRTPEETARRFGWDRATPKPAKAEAAE
jgi:hypothetical protein